MLADRMASSLSREGIITDEEREIVQFGLESLGGNLLGIGLALTIGFCFNRIGDAVFLWVWLFPLRKNAGGFHASTKTRCFLVSALMLLLSFAFFTGSNCTNILYGTSVLITGWIIWMLAPMDNPSKELDEVEYKIYRLRSRSILISETIVFMLALCFKWKMLVRSIAMTFFIVSLSLLMGVIKLLICNKING